MHACLNYNKYGGMVVKKKISLIMCSMLMFFGLFSFSGKTVLADSYYEGVGISRSKCTLKETYTASQLKLMGKTYNDQASKIKDIGIAAAFTPILGRYLGAGAALISSEAGKRGNTLIELGNKGYKMKRYYCEKVNWDGYSPRSYNRWKAVK